MLLIQAYALTAKGVRLVCTNTTGKNKNSVVLKTQGSGSLKDNIITVFGMNTFTCLDPLNLFISDTCQVDGFLSKSGNGSGRYLTDRQYFFVNGRPVDMPKVSKLVNELYRSANSKQYPIIIMNFVVPTKVCDINVTPDKRKIFFSDEGSLLKSLKEALLQIYSPNLASFTVQTSQEFTPEAKSSTVCSQNDKSFSQFSLKQVSPDEKQLPETPNVMSEGEETLKSSPAVNLINLEDYSLSKTDFTLKSHDVKKSDTFSASNSKKQTVISNNTSYNRQKTSSYNSSKLTNVTDETDSPRSAGPVQSLLTTFVTVNKRKHESISNALSEAPVLRNGPTFRQSVKQSFNSHSTSAKSSVKHQVVDDCDEVDRNESKPRKRTLVDEDDVVSDVTPIKVVKSPVEVDEVCHF